ncbi:hypothetical protein J2X65_003715 [Ancylobacter sp. 3268]|uniref:DUF930 domain-containing protein n=1 Tax=Ancylobacter sp. 3268 TaxID=2817752 RepID=UPI0028625DBE|nr:DUF930 domain-containing protein [Ancylobacter sp. 3268]MDR6954345.1 hypothetical protein [Ancylobacter sp. 3268]
MTSAPRVELSALDALRPHPARKRRGEGAARLAGALALHLAALAAALMVAAAPFVDRQEGPAIETEVISARDFDALRGVAPAPSGPPPAAAAPEVPATPSAGPPPPAAVPAKPDDMIRPTRMLSAQVLADPHSRATRRALATLAEEERIAQLCDLEAMEQIHAWRPGYQPDRLVDYARADTRRRGNSLIAGGGAFRSGLKWYEVSFSCELDGSLRQVVGFAFKVGAPIPRQDWTALSLPAVH